MDPRLREDDDSNVILDPRLPEDDGSNVMPVPRFPSFLRRQESIPNGHPDTAQWTVMKRLF